MTFPSEDMALTHILVVSDMEKSKHFYVDILGAELSREYGGYINSSELSWQLVLLVTEGGLTEGKPEISFRPSNDKSNVDHAFTIRVKDCQESYEILKDRGAAFITPPYDWGAEIRCFFQDPDGNLFEISEA